MAVRIASLHIYPIKSCGGGAVAYAACTPRGLEHDREFILVGADGQFLTQRTVPRMCLIAVELDADALTVRGPRGSERLRIYLNDRPAGEGIALDIWKRPGSGVDMGDAAARWFTAQLDLPCRLLRYDDAHPRRRKDPRGGADIPLSFADGYPLTVISQASLDDLNARLAQPVTPVTMDRFRPNLVVTGCPAYAEDGWESVTLPSGQLALGELNIRCAIPQVDPQTGICGKEPLQTLSTYRRLPALPGYPIEGVAFGRKIVVHGVSQLTVGDQLTPNPL